MENPKEVSPEIASLFTKLDRTGEQCPWLVRDGIIADLKTALEKHPLVPGDEEFFIMDAIKAGDLKREKHTTYLDVLTAELH